MGGDVFNGLFDHRVSMAIEKVEPAKGWLAICSEPGQPFSLGVAQGYRRAV